MSLATTVDRCRMYVTHRFDSYDEYLTVQRHRAERTKTVTRKHRWCREWALRMIKTHFPQTHSILCVGARHSLEVEFFCSAGFDALGIDLYDAPPAIRCCDMSKIYLHPELGKLTWDVFVMIHSIEHCLDVPGFLRSLRSHCADGLVCWTPFASNTSQWDCTAFDFVVKDRLSSQALETFFSPFRYVDSIKGRSGYGFVLGKNAKPERGIHE